MTVKEMRSCTGLSQSKFARLFDIPSINVALWEQGRRVPPDYVVSMMERILRYEGYIDGKKNDDR